MNRSYRFLLIAAILFPDPSPAGTATQKMMQSTTLKKEMYYWVYLPANYQQQVQSGRRFSVVYLLHQYSYWAASWHMKAGALPNPQTDRAVDSVTGIICVAPDDGMAGKSWWLDSPTKADAQLSTFLISDLKKAIDAGYATLTGRGNTGVCGVSMGGYGTLHNLRIHPEIYSVGYSIVGCVNLQKWQSQFDIPGVLSTYNVNFDIHPNAATYKTKNVKFKFYTTSTDFFKDDNAAFHNALTAAQVPHEYELLPGAHEPPTPEKMVEILRYFQSNFAPTAASQPAAVIPRAKSPGMGKHRLFVQLRNRSHSERQPLPSVLSAGVDGRARPSQLASGASIEVR